MAMFVPFVFVACQAQTAAEKRVEAAAAYEAQQMACVEQYADTAHIDACRDRVKKAWATDAGAEAGK
jgi:hypothetical protein